MVIFCLADLVYQTLNCHLPCLLLMRNRGLSGGRIKMCFPAGSLARVEKRLGEIEGVQSKLVERGF